MVVSGGDALQAVTLPAVGQQEGTPVTVPLRIANGGDAPLSLSFALRPRSENVLLRERWLDASGNPAQPTPDPSNDCSAEVCLLAQGSSLTVMPVVLLAHSKLGFRILLQME